MSLAAGPSRVRIVVLVPARDEARVIGRKLRNLAWCSWPEGEGHLCCVVDDGSSDGTAELAEREGVGFAGARLEVYRNEGRAGKAAAIGAALASLEARGERFDVVLLSDADVLLARDALVRCVERLSSDERLGVVCGAQVFVRDLGPGPAPESADGSAPAPASELYDRWTARVRRFESRWGRLFSLHGQLCAWRAGLGLEPPAGLAADDLELGFRARLRGLRVELVSGARFFEACVTAPACESLRPPRHSAGPRPTSRSCGTGTGRSAGMRPIACSGSCIGGSPRQPPTSSQRRWSGRSPWPRSSGECPSRDSWGSRGSGSERRGPGRPSCGDSW